MTNVTHKAVRIPFPALRNCVCDANASFRVVFAMVACVCDAGFPVCVAFAIQPCVCDVGALPRVVFAIWPCVWDGLALISVVFAIRHCVCDGPGLVCVAFAIGGRVRLRSGDAPTAGNVVVLGRLSGYLVQSMPTPVFFGRVVRTLRMLMWHDMSCCLKKYHLMILRDSEN